MGWPCAKAGQTELTGLDSDLEMHTGGLLESLFMCPCLISLTWPLSDHGVGQKYGPRS